MLRALPEAKKWLQRQERKRGKRRIGLFWNVIFGVELAALPGQHLARRGFWGANLRPPRPLGSGGRDAVEPWERGSA